MFGCECFWWNSVPESYPSQPEPFSLPAPLPQWPQGDGFASGRISLGRLEVLKVSKFERVWSCPSSHGKSQGFVFYKPLEIPDGFFCLGHYCQSNDQPLRGHVLVARETCSEPELESPALKKPINYSLIWSADSPHDGCGYFWLPNPPLGYKAMGIVVTNKPDEPEVEEVRCVRADLTETCETCDLLLSMSSKFSRISFKVWNTRPCKRGMWGRGVSVGTFFCSTYSNSEKIADIACLKNLDSTLHAMPNINQVHALINEYGPTVYFHPDEIYLPSSVQWFFKNGALVYSRDSEKGKAIDYQGSNLPSGGTNDGAYWIDLPTNDDARNNVKKGDIESAELYVHVKPALGGTFTDIAMWVFCPFNGPGILQVGLVNIEMNKIGEHVGDWEHFTLRVSNFTGELWSVFFSQHSGGEWVDAFGLEFIEGNKPVVYSSRHGHASFPHPGSYLQGSSTLGIGAKNEAAKSKLTVDSSTRYKVVAAEYLGEGEIAEPCWLQYMREWGPTVVYDSRSEIDKLIDLLPVFVRFSLVNLFELFPTELYGEEGPIGPKGKANWLLQSPLARIDSLPLSVSRRNAMDWAFVHKTWDKWASTNIGYSGHPLKAALLINYDPTGPSRLLSTIAEQEGIRANPIELSHFVDFIKQNKLQSELFIIGSNQCRLKLSYLVTSIHENWFSARCINTSKPAGEGAIVIQSAAYILVALYEGSIGPASRAMAAADHGEEAAFSRGTHCSGSQIASTQPEKTARVLTKKTDEAYVTLLYGDEFLLGVRVLGKSIRNTGSNKDMVVLVSDGVSDYAKSLLRADGWIVEMISLLANPNRVRPKRFWGVYTKLKIFNMTDYKKVVYLDADTIVVKNIDDLFKCGKFCANLKHSERLNSGVMVVEPSATLFNDMMSKIKTTASYTGGDQGFLNSYYSGFPNAHVFEPNLSPEMFSSRPIPEMERLSTLYNADVGLYMLANKWMVDENELRVIHYTLGPLKPWDWWTSWLLKPVDVWQDVREQLDESLPGTGGGQNSKDSFLVKFLFLLPFCALLFCCYHSFTKNQGYFSTLCRSSLCDQVRHLYYRIRSNGPLAYNSISTSTTNSVHQCLAALKWCSEQGSCIFGWHFCLCLFCGCSGVSGTSSLDCSSASDAMDWIAFDWGKIVGSRVASSLSQPGSDYDSEKRHQRQISSCDVATWYYGLGMALLAIAAPSLPCLFGITALFLRLGLMVVGGIILASFMTYASEHLAIRSFLKGFDERENARNSGSCFLC
ncbi:hypothetical protein JHK86_054470 [Glycine max]|nr:hypothetical protein JHK86_054470 [Glycine max]